MGGNTRLDGCGGRRRKRGSHGAREHEGGDCGHGAGREAGEPANSVAAGAARPEACPKPDGSAGKESAVDRVGSGERTKVAGDDSKPNDPTG